MATSVSAAGSPRPRACAALCESSLFDRLTSEEEVNEIEDRPRRRHLPQRIEQAHPQHLDTDMKPFEIRARFDDSVIRVYQAFSPVIASPALATGRFVPPFSLSRMTWIKPSFNWMMYRSGYATKPGQETVLAIDVTRAGFDWALRHAVLSTRQAGIHSSDDEWRRLLAELPVRVQWDPERNWRLEPIDGIRAIQIGLSGEALARYVNDWIVRIEDVTSVALNIRQAATAGFTLHSKPDDLERAYPIDFDTARNLIPRVQ
jgi:hypothetical protein